MNIFTNKAKRDDSLSPACLLSSRSLTHTETMLYKVKESAAASVTGKVSKLEGERICQLLLLARQGIHTRQSLIDKRPVPSLKQSMTIFQHKLIDSAVSSSQCLTHSIVISVITDCLSEAETEVYVDDLGF